MPRVGIRAWNMIDMTGKDYGYLKVIEYSHTYQKPSGQSVALWKCKCQCGLEFISAGNKIRSGHTKGCGCTIGKRLNPIEPSYETRLRSWSKLVRLRDNNTCARCGHTFSMMIAHHILCKYKRPELAFDINNGITFCNSCHKTYHEWYGYGQLTREGLDHFLQGTKT